jgi:hypothetical protein
MFVLVQLFNKFTGFHENSMTMGDAPYTLFVNIFINYKLSNWQLCNFFLRFNLSEQNLPLSLTSV